MTPTDSSRVEKQPLVEAPPLRQPHGNVASVTGAAAGLRLTVNGTAQMINDHNPQA
jgi:hypothetical protein